MASAGPEPDICVGVWDKLRDPLPLTLGMVLCARWFLQSALQRDNGDGLPFTPSALRSNSTKRAKTSFRSYRH